MKQTNTARAAMKITEVNSYNNQYNIIKNNVNKGYAFSDEFYKEHYYEIGLANMDLFYNPLSGHEKCRCSPNRILCIRLGGNRQKDRQHARASSENYKLASIRKEIFDCDNAKEFDKYVAENYNHICDCAICNDPVNYKDLSFDRIDNSLGHSIENIQLTHYTCNIRAGAR
jgi:hypothetical protein